MKNGLMSIFGVLLALSAPAAAQDAPKIPSPSTPTQSAEPLDPASVALARQIITVAFPPEKREDLFAGVLDSIVSQMRSSMASANPIEDKGLAAITDRAIQRMFDQMKPIINAHLPDYFDSMANAYARSFSPDELRQIAAFADTPAGQKFFQRGPMIVKDPDVMGSNKRMMAELMGKMPEFTSEFTKEIEDYLAKKLDETPAQEAAPGDAGHTS